MQDIMFVATLLTLTLHTTTSTNDKQPEANMTTTQIIAYYGYPFEIHHVTTEDGYILEMHRIVYGKNESRENAGKPKTIVFLQHGFIGSSAVWVTNLPNGSAAFLFADHGFDVWMGNVRGNTYSTGHTHLAGESNKYWKFTWDEFSKYDLSSMINYVLNKTNQSCVNYVGYSEGTLTMFAKLSVEQSFASKLCKFFALGPIGTLVHIKGLVRTAAKHFMQPLKLLVKFGAGQFMSNKSLFRRMSKSTCSLRQIVDYCENLMFQITGPDTTQMNQTRIPVYMTHLPAGTSMANVLHWAQMVNSHKTQMYDFGSYQKNMQRYNQTIPPIYNLSAINTPVYLYWSDADWLATKRDVQDGLVAKIPSANLIENNQLPHFNHFDFIWGVQAADKIYKPIIGIIDGIANTHHQDNPFTESNKQ